MFLRTFLKYVDCSSTANIAGCKMAIIADMMRVTRLVRLQLKKVVVFVGLDGQEKSQTSPLFCPDGQGLFQKITFESMRPAKVASGTTKEVER